MKNSIYLVFLKPTIDFLLSLVGIIILSPIFIILAILIKLSSKGPVIFKQIRVGKNFKEFYIYKFRTMIEHAENKGEQVTVTGDSRVTKIGRLLRKFKLDEIPQLFNVIFGQMSIVGPRPEVKKYVYQFKGDYNHILKLKPGITDYAALKYRNEEEVLSNYDNVEQGYVNEVLPAKINLYRKYIEEVSLITDVKIMLLTLIKVVK